MPWRLDIGALKSYPKTRSIGGSIHDWVALCPCHSDENPSLSIKEVNDNVLVHCFAGCDGKQVLQELWSRGIVNMERDIVDCADYKRNAYYAEQDQVEQKREIERQGRDYAKTLWNEGVSIVKSPGEAYFQSRGLKTGYEWFRWNPFKNEVLAVIRDGDNVFQGIHRTFVVGGKKTGVKVNGKILGGHIDTHYASLAGSTQKPGLFAVAEGIETALSFTRLTGMFCWPLINAANMANFEPHSSVRVLNIAADLDGAGLTAAERLQSAAINIYKVPFVEIWLPGDHNLPGTVRHKMDFNDVLKERYKIDG